MNCPYCSAPLGNVYVCGNCGQTDPLMKKVIYASNWHYNQGLEKIKVKDLTGASISLRTSLKYNKRNIDARNLLGLIYYQTGEIVAALGEWVISVHLQRESNIANTYIRAIQNNPGKLQQANKTIQKYNLALRYLEQNNPDMAIIELKKVVNLSPNYVRAYQLLGLLYIKTKQYAAARKVLVRSLRVDRNNITSLRYLDELTKIVGEKSKNKSKKKEDVSTINDPNPVVIEEKTTNRYTDFNTSLLSFVNVIIGIIIGGAVVWLLLVPAVQKSEVSKYNEAVVEYSSQISDKNKEISRLSKEIEDMTLSNEILQGQLDKFSAAADEGSNDLLLVQAANAYLLEDLGEAGQLLANINVDLLDSEDAKQLYDKILQKTKDSTVSILYQNGTGAFNNENYTEAITYFNKILNLDNEHVNSIYYMAASYRNLADLEKASTYYQRIVNEFPNSEWAETAASALGEME